MAPSDSPDPSSHRPFLGDDAFAEEELQAELNELDDDDMDFEPDADDDEGDDDFEYHTVDGEDDIDIEDEESIFHDAEDGEATSVEFQLTFDAESNEATDARATRGGQPVEISRAQLLRILANPQIRNLLQGGRSSAGETDEEDDDDDDDDMFMRTRRRRIPRDARVELPPVPNPKGRELQDSGVFGISEPYRDRLRRRKKKLARRVMQRELGGDKQDIRLQNQLLSQELIPGTPADTIIHYDTRCYSGQFADDGNFFFTCSQDFNVRMYDTSNPSSWKHYKTLEYPYGQWTLTDASLSRDNKFIAFSSIRSMVCLATTDPDSSASPHQLDFSDTVGGGLGARRRFRDHHRQFGIWSIRFSGDGREIVAGTAEHAVYVYDIDAGRSILRIPGHEDDVNAVCFGDKSSPHILYSGSDDSLIKVWDRRSMGDSREAGVFMGHTEGLTYVDSKGDGRYVLSNGKDQSMKLWDLRMMMGTDKASTINSRGLLSGFDYRFMDFTDDDYRQHPHDCSVVTFRGHSVLKTLIRCHFSPASSTDSRYVYSGSEDGSVYVYNLDATIAKKIDVNKATLHTRPRDPSISSASIFIDDRHGRGPWKTCVRDASWHPSAPIIAATSWNGYGMSTGTCTVHSWNDGAEEDECELGMGRRVNHVLAEQPEYYRENQRSATRRRGGGGGGGGIVSSIVRRVTGNDEEGGW